MQSTVPFRKYCSVLELQVRMTNVMLFIHLIVYCCILLTCVYGDWGLKEMGKSYMDEKIKDETDLLDSANYVPLKKGQLCDEEKTLDTHKYKTCQDSSLQELRVLVVDQLPVMATQLGCGKRMFHMLEALVGLGYEVSLGYLRPDMHETEKDTGLMDR